MDLIYANEENIDLGVLTDYTFDLAFGENENDFQLEMPLVSHCIDQDYKVYIEGTEYGGIVDSITVDTNNNTVTYEGRTWHGIFNSKVITPATGDDYYVISGDANDILAQIISEYDYGDLFVAETEPSGVVLPSTNVDRYKSAYDVLLKRFRDNGGKLKFTYDGTRCKIECVPLVDYSQDEEFDSDQLTFKLQKNYNPVNHLICLGKGELKDRQRIDLYADESGNISTTQSITGLAEVVDVYDYSSVESGEELEKEGIKHFKEIRKDGDIDVDLEQTQDFDISDKIGAIEYTTGISVVKYISKKIVKIDEKGTVINYNING
jgi:hypothetical protein